MSDRNKPSLLLVALLLAGLGACDPSHDGPARAERHLTEGVEALVAGEFERAWPLCDEARRLRPEDPAAARCAALASVGWGRWDLAARDLQMLLDRAPPEGVEDWIPVTLWLARVRINDEAGAVRVLDGLSDGPAADPIRQAILALALAEGADTPAWGIDATRIGGWDGVLPLIRAGRTDPGGGLPPRRAGEDREVTGYRAVVEALEGTVSGAGPEGEDLPPEIQVLLIAASGEAPASSPQGSDPSMIILRRFFDAERGGCALSDDLTTDRAQAAAALLEGVCLERRGDVAAALARYDVAVALAPWNLVARLDRALLLARTGRIPAARVELAHLSEVAPGHPILRVLEGVLAGASGEAAVADAARAELQEIAPAYGEWMDEVLAE